MSRRKSRWLATSGLTAAGTGPRHEGKYAVMTNPVSRWGVRLFSLLVMCLAAVVLFNVVLAAGWLSPFGLRSESHDTQVIQAIKRTQEVSLLSLAVQGITDKEQNSTVFGHDVPGSGEKVILQYEFSAKLGLDGSQVKVEQSGESTYKVTIPKFIFIGYEDPTFKTIVDTGGLLRFTTADINKVEMVNEILNSDARNEYIDQNEELLRDQAKVFYESLITSVEPEAKVAFEYAS